jgi:hypothetical protein
LNKNEREQAYTDFLKKNADAALASKNGDGVIVDRWQGGSNGNSAASHASGIDVLVAAAQAST